MIRKLGFALTLAAVTTAASATTADAQLGFGIAGGPSFATGDLGDGTEMGYHVQGSVNFTVPMIPVGLRADALWNQFPTSGTEEGKYQHIVGSVNAVFSLPSIGFTPYAIAGVGYYNSKFSHDDEPAGHDHGSSNDFGINGGIGVRLGLPGLNAFAEARLHNIFGEGDSSPRFIPLSIGLSF